MSRAALKRVEAWLAGDFERETDRFAYEDTKFALDVRAVLALAKSAIAEDEHLALMTPCKRTRHPVRDCACSSCARKRAALRNPVARGRR